uniref:Uncharacterized protein n=1 Tax=Anguilla anguilla TaxID=7936 RepID=A0A0E9SR48_ANGAN
MILNSTTVSGPHPYSLNAIVISGTHCQGKLWELIQAFFFDQTLEVLGENLYKSKWTCRG